MSTAQAFSTDAFPYTAGYVSELLGVNDSDLDYYARILGIGQQRDERTGKLIFFHRDVELLKRAVSMVRNGEDIHDIAQRLTQPQGTSFANEAAQKTDIVSRESSPRESTPRMEYSSPSSQAASQPIPQAHQTATMAARPTAAPERVKSYASDASPLPLANYPHPASPAVSSGFLPASNRDSLAVMVETVSQVKEGIIKDLSRMLDDKLSGLDEVVVQLIRSQSENESLKKRLEEAQREKEELERELASFRLVQFGFYKKVNR